MYMYMRCIIEGRVMHSNVLKKIEEQQKGRKDCGKEEDKHYFLLENSDDRQIRYALSCIFR